MEELGVENMGEIIAYQRPKNSGSQTALEALMGDTPLMEAPQNLVSDGMDDILETIDGPEDFEKAIKGASEPAKEETNYG